MANGRPSILKRERERKRASRAAEKREERGRRDAAKPDTGGAAVASEADLEGYGIEQPFTPPPNPRSR